MKKSKKKGNSKLTAIGCHKNGTAWPYKAVMHLGYANNMANSVDQIRLLQKEQSDLGLHCLS